MQKLVVQQKCISVAFTVFTVNQSCIPEVIEHLDDLIAKIRM